MNIQKSLGQGTEVTGVVDVGMLSGFCMEDGWKGQSIEEAAEELRLCSRLAVRARGISLSVLQCTVSLCFFVARSPSSGDWFET